MATSVQLDLPDELLASVTRRAEASGRAVREQLLADIARSNAKDEQEEQLLDQIRADREAMARKGIKATDEILAEAKAWGRR